MDWENPLRSIAPTVDADVLAALAGTHEPVTGNRLAKLARRSYAQVTVVVRRLVEEGIVHSEQYGRTYVYQLNREHLLASGLAELLSAPQDFKTAMTDAVETWAIQPDAVALFGSVARREATRNSDIDLLVVRRDNVDMDNERWQGQLTDLVLLAEKRSGNRVQIVEVDQSELREAIGTDQPLVQSLRDDASMIHGDDLQPQMLKADRGTE